MTVSLLGIHSHAAFSPSSACSDRSPRYILHPAHTTSSALAVSAEVPLGFPISYVLTVLATSVLAHYMWVSCCRSAA